MLSVTTLILHFAIVELEGEVLSHGQRDRRISLLWIFLWGHLKTLVYETPVETAEDLTARVLAACRQVQLTLGIFERVRQNVIRRCNACIENGGRHFEQLL